MISVCCEIFSSKKTFIFQENFLSFVRTTKTLIMISESKTGIGSEQFKERKEKWEIMMDCMMIVGKYFETNSDYVNVMRVCKKYQQLTQMYHFNPISECSLFENMESQYLYAANDEKCQIEGVKRYIYWYEVDYCKFHTKQTNEIFKRLELTSERFLLTEEGHFLYRKELHQLEMDVLVNVHH